MLDSAGAHMLDGRVPFRKEKFGNYVDATREVRHENPPRTCCKIVLSRSGTASYSTDVTRGYRRAPLWESGPRAAEVLHGCPITTTGKGGERQCPRPATGSAEGLRGVVPADAASDQRIAGAPACGDVRVATAGGTGVRYTVGAPAACISRVATAEDAGVRCIVGVPAACVTHGIKSGHTEGQCLAGAPAACAVRTAAAGSARG